METESRGMRMWSGQRVSVTDGAPTLDDIARGLAHANRFGGQTSEPWSVAKHSLLCLDIFNRWSKFSARAITCVHVLLHDAHEAMTGDIPRAFKTREMSEIQHDLDRRIYEALGLARFWPLSDSDRAAVKYVDNRALLAEAKLLTPDATYQECLLDFNGMSEAMDEDIEAALVIVSRPKVDAMEYYKAVVLQGITEALSE